MRVSIKTKMLYQNYHFNVAVEGVSKLINTVTLLTNYKL